MAVDLTNVYDKIAALNMSFTDSNSVAQTVGVIKYDTMKSDLTGIALPTRVLWLVLPTSSDGISRPGSIGGSGQTVEWSIDDTMYLASEGEGYGLADVTHDLILYINKYASVMGAGRKLQNGINVTEWKFEPGIFKWGKVNYMGVNVALKVTEISKSG